MSKELLSGELYEEELPEILSPKIDLVFKAIFGNEKNGAILADFLTAVLGLSDGEITAESICIIDPQKSRTRINDKLTILDVKLTLKNEKVINVEMQVDNIKAMANRIMFNLAEMLSCQLNQGDDYAKLTPVISIVVADYALLKNNIDYHNEFAMLEKNKHFAFSDLMTIHTLELPKLPQSKDGKLEDWLKFLKSEKKEDFMAVAQKNSAINMALDKLISVSADGDFRDLYKARIKAQRDERGKIAYGFDQGMQQGMQKGMQQVLAILQEQGYDINAIKSKLPQEFV